MKIKDERIIHEHNLITARAYAIILIGMTLVTFYRIYVLNQSFAEYKDYVLVMFAAMLYTLFMTVKKGLYHNYAQTSSSLRFKLGVSIAAGISVMLSKFLSGQSINLLDFIIAGVVTFAVSFTTINIAIKRKCYWEQTA